MIYIPKVEFSSDAAVRNKIEAIPTDILIFKFFFLSHLHFQLYVFFLHRHYVGYFITTGPNLIWYMLCRL